MSTLKYRFPPSKRERKKLERSIAHETAMKEQAVLERNRALRGAGRARTPEERQLHTRTAERKIKQRKHSTAAIRRMQTLLPPKYTMPSEMERSYMNRLRARIKPDRRATPRGKPERRATLTPLQYAHQRTRARRGRGRLRLAGRIGRTIRKLFRD